MVDPYIDGVAREKFTTTNEGGSAYSIDNMTQLRRFLIMGTDSGSFYASPKALTNMNIKSVKQALNKDYRTAIDTIVTVSDQALAPSNEPALLALSIAASHDNVEVRQYALDNLSNVARTSTHLFHFVGYVTQQRGWGNALRRAVANWYTDRSTGSLVNQLTKYQSRDGWSHKDLINLSHPKPRNETQEQIFRYVTYGDNEVTADVAAQDYFAGIKLMNQSTDTKFIADMIKDYNYPREVLPTSALNSTDIWAAMLPSMPYMAMIRNLAKMTEVELITPLSNGEQEIINKIQNTESLKSSRIHPIDILKAKLTYQSGRGQLGSLRWTPSQRVVTALEDAFYASFGNVEPTGKRGIIAFDVSKSMTWSNLLGIPGFTPRVASAVMGMVTVRVENESHIVGFSHEIEPLDIRQNDSLDEVVRKMERMPFGNTYCHLPIEYAIQHNMNVDYFITYTDSETRGNPADYLRQYRQERVPNARNIVVAMLAGNFSLADPNDLFALDVSGFDSSVPVVISEFVKGVI